MEAHQDLLKAYAKFLELVDAHRGRIIAAALEGHLEDQLHAIMREDAYEIGDTLIQALPMDDPVLPLICSVMEALAASIAELMEKGEEQ